MPINLTVDRRVSAGARFLGAPELFDGSNELIRLMVSADARLVIDSEDLIRHDYERAANNTPSALRWLQQLAARPRS